MCDSGLFENIDWPAPCPLEGVKSRKRLIFEVESEHVDTGCETIKVRNLSLSLSSRVVAVGEKGHAAAALLLLDSSSSSSSSSSKVLAKRHTHLKVVRLAPSEFPCADTPSEYDKAISSALVEQRPHIVVLSEEGSSENAAWKIAFDKLVCGESIWKFQGALVICAAAETEVLQAHCSERWVAQSDATGAVVGQRPCFRVTENALVAGLKELQEDAAQIPYCELRHWIQSAQAQGSKVTRFDAGGCEGPGRLCGLIFHHMIESSSEFHVRFIFVPKEQRKSGTGSMMMRWVIEQASLMPLSECKWISLQCSDDELLPWYEKFGFFDMSCGHTEDDGGETRMELPNVPAVEKALS